MKQLNHKLKQLLRINDQIIALKAEVPFEMHVYGVEIKSFDISVTQAVYKLILDDLTRQREQLINETKELLLNNTGEQNG